jgi:hypothetical protein
MDLDTPKVSVVLRNQNDWRAWYDNVKTTAKARQVWEYVNPELLVQPFEPMPPAEPGFHLVKTGVTNITQFTAEEYEHWKRLIKDHDRKNTQYEKNLRNLNAIKTLIRSSIARQHHHYIYGKLTAYEELKALRNRFAPTDRERKKELKHRYQQLQKSPRSTEVDSWLSNWEEIYAEGLEADLPAVKDDPVEDFVNACERLNPEFHQYWSNRLEDPDIGNNMDLHKIIDAFRIFRKRTTKRDANKEISLASFQGQTLEKEMDSKTSTEYTEPRKFRKDCPCGKKHFFKDCFYVNERIRPENWKPEPEIEKNFEKACENMRFKAGYENARKRFSKKDEG